VAVFLNVLIMASTLGALLRLSFSGSSALASVRLQAVAVGIALLGGVAGALAIDPATGARDQHRLPDRVRDAGLRRAAPVGIRRGPNALCTAWPPRTR
jgi:hypothetical protein